MKRPIPIFVDEPMMRMLLRSRENAALLFGDDHADAVRKLIDIARRHRTHALELVLLEDGQKETLVARVAGRGEWQVVRAAQTLRRHG